MHRSTKTSKLRVSGFCEGNPPVSGGLPSQRARNAEDISIWWRRHENDLSWNTHMKALGINTDHFSADILDDSTPTWFNLNLYDDALTWRHFLQHWPFVRGIQAISGLTPQRARMRRLDISFVVILNKLLNNQSSCRWFKMPEHSCISHVSPPCHNNEVRFWGLIWYKDVVLPE